MLFPFSIRPQADFDAVGFGTNAIDYLIRVPVYPKYNSKVELNDYTIAPGGEIASSMAGLARLGMRCSYAGRFGDDEAGVIGLRSLLEDGVDLSYAESVAGAATQVAFIIVDEMSGERTVIWKRDDKLRYGPDDAPLSLAERGRVIHLTPHDGEAAIRLATSAKNAGVVVSADVDNIFEGLDELLRLVDVCIMSADLPGHLMGIEDPQIALREVSLSYGCAITGLTLGRRGSLLFCRDEFIESAGYDVPGGCVDTTGAGDAFRAGFLFGMLNGHSVERSAAYANGVASLKCRHVGARKGLPGRDELRSLVDIG